MLSNNPINSYIDERINSNYDIVRKDEYYKKKMERFNIVYETLYNKLSDEEKKELEEIYGLQNDILSLENYLAYKIGKSDGRKEKEVLI